MKRNNISRLYNRTRRRKTSQVETFFFSSSSGMSVDSTGRCERTIEYSFRFPTRRPFYVYWLSNFFFLFHRVADRRLNCRVMHIVFGPRVFQGRRQQRAGRVDFARQSRCSWLRSRRPAVGQDTASQTSSKVIYWTCHLSNLAGR